MAKTDIKYLSPVDVELKNQNKYKHLYGVRASVDFNEKEIVRNKEIDKSIFYI